MNINKKGVGIVKNILVGQALLVVCCVFYLIWWYRGFRPGVYVNRVGGVNGLLLAITAALGLAGLFFSLYAVEGGEAPAKTHGLWILIGGIGAYILLFIITRFGFQRIVTSELFLIVGWTMLEISVIDRLHAAGALPAGRFWVMMGVVACAFMISIVLYVAYYKMEEMKAFYAAMVPLITEGLTMVVLLGMAL